jgi:hypothetical protein
LKKTPRFEIRFAPKVCPEAFPIKASDNPGVDIATSGLSQVDYGAENRAGKRWV